MAKGDPLQARVARGTLSRELVRLRESEQQLREQNAELLEGQRLLEDARDDFAELYDGAPVPLLTLGAQATIRSANLAAAELFERERWWLVGRSFQMLFRERDRSRVAACLNERSRKDCRAELVLPNETLVPVQFSRRFSERRAGVSHVSLMDLRASLEVEAQHAKSLPLARARRRILLVEDNLETAEVVQEVLERHGYGVVSADSVEAAIGVDLARIDAIVSDILLPDGRGTDLLRQLKRARDVPAIAFSGMTKSTDVESAKQAGFDLYLTKPVDFPRLLSALGTMLEAAPPQTISRPMSSP